MKVTGKIKVIYDTVTFDSGFTKREFVVTTHETYPQDIKIEVIKDKCSLLDLYQVGNIVDVSINLKGSEYNGKYYNSIQAWRIEKADVTEGNIKPPVAEVVEDESDDLPF